ncbi:lactonase family protein [Flavihumibacter petaseus]|uniref:6-phosphogluconolactonase n=1 Tax=Flavihumibacter petaseus NBRC 106054 TaxID=1220578 RepID=A0A0E9N1H6_9BACT|nr:lactonase family protein [Flavihumibacter petaseus]GAO43628.1 6-phosphogluconolactonase [Flavihumibacter petaseus NBRC 106054]
MRIAPFLLSFFACCAAIPAQSQMLRLYVGTYTSDKSEGIYLFNFDPATGTATPGGVTSGVSNPSYLTLSKDGKNLYAVNENGGKEPGSISAFSVNPSDGKLTFLNKLPSGGDYPCYITASDNRKWVIAANYGGGSLVAYPLLIDGSLADKQQLIQHTGKGTNPDRQEGPHVHSTTITPDGRYVLVCDLGLDKIFTYKFNSEADQTALSAANPPFAATAPGDGPRHIAFHPNGRWFFEMGEMSGKVSSWQYKKGKMTMLQSVDAHTPQYSGDRGSADIHVSPDGKFVYASNRYASNNIAIISIDPKTGMMTNAGFQDLKVKKPRNFVIDPSGKYLLVAGQESGGIEVFERNAETGQLTSKGIIDVPNPVCLKFF